MENWIILNSTTGNSGETQITLQVAENTNYSARTTTLTVRTRSKNLTDTVVINQQAKAATGQMTFNPSALSYTYEGGTIPFSITANEDWRVVSWPTWVGITGDGTSGGTGTYNWGVTALRNSTTSDLDSTFTFYCGGNYFTVPVHQDAYSEQPTGSTEYLTFEIISGGTIYWKTQNENYTKTIEYQINGGSWNSITSSTDGTPININSGDILKIRGDNNCYPGVYTSGSSTSIYLNYFRSDISTIFDIRGNIMSLINSTNFSTLTTLPSDRTFMGLFACRGLINASELLLPATALTTACYQGMFQYCISLTTAPELPATTLTNECYAHMFENCTSLTTAPELLAITLADDCYAAMFWNCSNLVNAPELPATTLARSCYASMFHNCTSLTTAPVLPATTLARGCYQYMFRGCSNLNYIKCLATNISANNCTDDWVLNVAPTGTFVKADSMTGWTIDSVDGVPIGWTLINASDEEPDYSKEYLTFEFKTNGTVCWTVSDMASPFSIFYSKDNGTTWNSLSPSTGGTQVSVVAGDKICFKGNGVTDSYAFHSTNSFLNTIGQFNVYGNIMSLINGTNFSSLNTLTGQRTFQNLFQNCTGLTDASNLILPATTLAYYCYAGMFKGCTSLTTAPELPATTLTERCYNAMFSGCTSLTTAPVLPATTLVEDCYRVMFYGCSSLNYIKCLATNDDIGTWHYTYDWVYGVASTGTFVKNSATTWPSGKIGIPTGWTVQDAT